MKLKCDPAEFIVKEKIKLQLVSHGDYAIYLVEKRNLTTFDLIQQLSRWMKRPVRSFSHAGLKDKYAQTEQHISLKGDGPEFISAPLFKAKRLGYTDEPVKPKHLKGNVFCILIRDLSHQEIDRLKENEKDLLEFGFPNYFDDQRFRSQPSAEPSIAFLLFKKEYQEALKIYVEKILPWQKKIDTDMQRTLLSRWNQWDEIEITDCPAPLQKSLTHLRNHPNDYQGAVFSLDYHDIRMMVTAAQSYLWNCMITDYLREKIKSEWYSFEGAWHTYWFYKRIPEDVFQELCGMSVAMPHADWHHDLQELKKSLKNSLTRHKLQKHELSIPRLRGISLETHERRVIAFPQDYKTSEVSDDDRYSGKKMVKLLFFLPPGSYATMLIKRLVAG